jgi:hypothetical protein
LAEYRARKQGKPADPTERSEPAEHPAELKVSGPKKARKSGSQAKSAVAKRATKEKNHDGKLTSNVQHDESIYPWLKNRFAVPTPSA